MYKGVFILVIGFILITSSNQQCADGFSALLIDGTSAFQGCVPKAITNCAGYDFYSTKLAAPVSKCVVCDPTYVLVGIKADGTQQC